MVNDLKLQFDRITQIIALCVGLTIGFGATDRAWALDCGFRDCPLRGAKLKPHPDDPHASSPDGWGVHSLQLSLDTAMVSLASDANGMTGYALEEAVGLVAELHPRLSIGVSAAYQWILPEDERWPGEGVSGFGNPLLSVEGELWADGALRLISGLQVVLPFGSKYRGVAEEHWEVMPYLSGSWTHDSFSTEVSVGFRESITDHEHGVDDSHPESAMMVLGYVDPNGAREWVVRGASGWASPDGEFSGLVYLDVKLPTMEEDIGEYVEAGVEIATQLTGALALSANLGKALYGNVRRAPLRSGLGFQYSF